MQQQLFLSSITPNLRSTDLPHNAPWSKRTCRSLASNVRVAGKPLSQTLQVEPLTDLATAIGDFLRASGTALRTRRMPPRLDGGDSALCSYAAAIGTIRQEGATSRLLSEVTERFFTLCFALKQIGHNLRKLHRCLAEWASTGPDGCRFVPAFERASASVLGRGSRFDE